MIAIPDVVAMLGMWWPDGDPDALNDAAADWETFGQTIEQGRTAAEKSAGRLGADQEGQAITACRESLADFTHDLGVTAGIAYDQAKTLRDYAQHVEHTQHVLIEMAIAAATIVAACTIGACFTLGATEGGAAAATAAVCTAADLVGITLSNTAATIIAGAIEAMVIDVIIQEARIHILHDGGFNWTEFGLSAGLGVLASGLGARLATSRAGSSATAESTVSAVPATSGTVGRGERLTELWRRLDATPRPRNAEEALGNLRRHLDDVEDQLSGVPKNPNPPMKSDGRMYPPRDDMVIRHDDGSITAATKGHTIEIAADGSMRVYLRHNGELAYTKGGGGG